MDTQYDVADRSIPGFVILRRFWPNGSVMKEEWRAIRDATLSRSDGPCISYWHENGTKGSEGWYHNNALHRIGGPALRRWMRDGSPEREEWYLNGHLHRIVGPASVDWIGNGCTFQQWFVDGMGCSSKTAYLAAAAAFIKNRDPFLSAFPEEWVAAILDGQLDPSFSQRVVSL